jgi:hypothetical protein
LFVSVLHAGRRNGLPPRAVDPPTGGPRLPSDQSTHDRDREASSDSEGWSDSGAHRGVADETRPRDPAHSRSGRGRDNQSFPKRRALQDLRQDEEGKMEALIALIGVLIGTFVPARFADKEQRRNEVLALAAFIDSLSELLVGMHEKLSNGVVPTSEGNQLLQALNGYTDAVARSRISKKRRKELESILPQLKTLLTTAEFEDEIIRGVVLTYDPKSRERLLQELERTAGRLKGMSDALKVV